MLPLSTREYLSPEFLDWPQRPEDSDFWRTNAEFEARPHELWSHARALLEQAPSRESRADAISNLKRAISLRVSALNSLYGLKKLTHFRRTNSLTLTMADFGIIRPLLLGQILDLRNRIEHQDELPPSDQRCAEWLDVVWYFLKSTDLLLRGGCNAISFDLDERDQAHPVWLVVVNGPQNNWMPVFRGWLPPAMLTGSLDPHLDFSSD